MDRLILTIAYPVFRDFDGAYFSSIDVPLTHPEICERTEIVVVDNEARPAGAKDQPPLENWVRTHLAGAVRARYVYAPETSGPAGAKQRCVDEAAGRFVLVMDSHVRIVPGGLQKLLTFYAQHPDTNDLYSGPMFYDSDALIAGRGECLKGFATHLDEVWRGENLGIWATDRRGACVDADPFEVPAMGCGLFTCRKESFVGFNPRFSGFGGEEYYIHHKTRQAGAKCICLPFLRWVHRFGRPGGPPYPVRLWDKIRNYVIGHQELGMPLDGIHQHFVTEHKRLSEKDWKYLVEDPIGRTIHPGAKSGCGSCGDKASIAANMTLKNLYEQAEKTPSDINQHVPKLRELAKQCETVVEFGHRRGVSTVGLLAGQPKHLTSYDLREDPIWRELQKRQGKTDFRFIRADVTQVTIPECDLLFEDSRHTAGHIGAILQRHAGKVRRFMAFHDTVIFGEQGEDGGPGILPALRRFMQEQPEWSVIYHTQANHGFTVLGKLPEDKPKLPPLAKQAWNYAKAIARHNTTGRKLASDETIRARLQVCATCPQRTHNRCAVCGCFLDEGPGGREGKAVWAESICPLGFWGRSTEPVSA